MNEQVFSVVIKGGQNSKAVSSYRKLMVLKIGQAKKRVKLPCNHPVQYECCCVRYLPAVCRRATRIMRDMSNGRNNAAT